MKKQCSQCMKIKDCLQGTLIGKKESIDVWLCRECRSGAHCRKCGEEINADEDSLCGNCV